MSNIVFEIFVLFGWEISRSSSLSLSNKRETVVSAVASLPLLDSDYHRAACFAEIGYGVIMVRDNGDACLADFLGRWRRDQYAGDRLVNIHIWRLQKVNSLRARAHIRIVDQLSCHGWLVALRYQITRASANPFIRQHVNFFLFLSWPSFLEKPHCPALNTRLMLHAATIRTRIVTSKTWST